MSLLPDRCSVATLSGSRSGSVRSLGRVLAGVLVALGLAGVGRAQWISESYTAKAGWNAIWVGIDLSHTTISDALADKADIEEIWRWNPPSGTQFVTNPASPVQQNPNWSVWKRGLPLQSTISQFTGNAAYLVKVRDGAADVNFSLKGRPLRPDYPWTTSGVNLVGFPTAASAPTFSRFLSFGSGVGNDPSILSYVGGALSSTAPRNPLTIVATSELVARGKAYWVQATQFTDYYGPIAVTVSERLGLNYGRTRTVLSVRLKNVTSGSTAQSVSVTLAPVASETPPAILAGTALMGTGADSGRVASISPDLNTGLTYATAPAVTISAPSAGTTATATAVLDAAGRIARFTITNAGAGYGSTTPTVTVTPVVAGAVPLKVRGALDPATSQYAYTNLGTGQTITLAAGAETEIFLAADRSAMGINAGALFGSLLRITDSLNLTRIELPVTAVTSDLTGVWTGVAMINQVDSIMGQSVRTAAVGRATATVSGGVVTGATVTTTAAFYAKAPTVVFTGGGGTGAAGVAKLAASGLLSGVDITAGGSGYTTVPTVSFTGGEIDPRGVSQAFPLRLILHRAANGDTRLVQQVYMANDGTTAAAATAESLFTGALRPSTRLSSAHFPSDFVRLGTGALATSGTVTFEVLLDYDSDSNPFVHRYHPDHDNLDARFESKLPQGRESLTVRRQITLTFQSSLPGVTDPTWGISMIGGTYGEVVTGLRSTVINCQGTFLLYRVADAATLLTP